MRLHFEEQNLDAPPDFFAPDLLPGAERYVRAYDRLAADRPLALGFGATVYGSIPFVAVERYAVRFGFAGPDEFKTFDRIICAMDAAELKILNSRKT